MKTLITAPQNRKKPPLKLSTEKTILLDLVSLSTIYFQRLFFGNSVIWYTTTNSCFENYDY